MSLNATRQIRSLCHGWEFFDGERPSGAWQPVSLPHTWNAEDLPRAGMESAPRGGEGGFAGYGTGDGAGYRRGVAWYRRRLEWEEGWAGRRLYLEFGAANQDAEVWVDGEKIATHLGGYTAFRAALPPRPAAGGAYDVRVRVSNAPNPAVPPLGGDLGHFGGLYREARLFVVGPCHFDLEHFGGDGVYWETPEVAPAAARLRVTARVRAPRPGGAWECVVRAPSGVVVARGLTPLPPAAGAGGVAVLAWETALERPELWSCETPALYAVENRLLDASGDELDWVTIPLGLRSFAADAARGFFLNGGRCFLRGVGRHQDYAGRGYAAPPEILVNDAREIKAMGANAVRSHYPLSPAAYAECDRQGLLAWVKIPVMDQMAPGAEFLGNAVAMLSETIWQLRNHPSIVIWGYACEILGGLDWFAPRPLAPEAFAAALRESAAFCRELQGVCKRLDPGRLTANDFHAAPHPEWYAQAGLTEINDLNGWNVYHGWYHRNLDEVESFLRATRDYAPGRPYLLAEYGAGADERLRAVEPTIYDMTPEYAARLHRHYWQVAQKLPWLAGAFVWVWSDFQRTSLGDCAGHLNNKGLVANDRRRKDGFYLHQALWGTAPVARIAGGAVPLRAGVADADGLLPETVTVYSNRPEVALWLNGQECGRAAPQAGAAVFAVRLRPGANALTARADDGTEDRQELQAVALPPHGGAGMPPEICVNVGQARAFYYDATARRLWLPDRELGEGPYGHADGAYFRSWPGADAWDGIRDGVNRHLRGTEHQPVFQSFLIGCTRYCLRLPRGVYATRLCFAEPFTAAARRERALPHGADAAGNRVFDVVVNGQAVRPGLCPAAAYGEQTAGEEACVVRVADAGLVVELRPRAGLPVLNGIAVRRLVG